MLLHPNFLLLFIFESQSLTLRPESQCPLQYFAESLLFLGLHPVRPLRRRAAVGQL